MRHKKADKYECKNAIETVCGVCGRTFLPAPYHVYHEAGSKARVCSYKCMCESEKKHEGNKKKTGAAAHKRR